MAKFKQFSGDQITLSLWKNMVRTSLGIGTTPNNDSAKRIKDMFFGGTKYALADIRNFYEGSVVLSGKDRDAIASAWNRWASRPKPVFEKKAIALLEKHIEGGYDLRKTDYDDIHALAKQIGQDKYGKSVFRGIQLTGGGEKKTIRDLHMSANPKHVPGIANQISDIVANKPVKLSTAKGGNRYAESWTIDPEIAYEYAEMVGPRAPFVILEARPAPKNIIIVMDYGIVNKIPSKIIKDLVPATLEVVLKTGNRKYTLCRNIRYINIPGNYIAENRNAIMNRIKDKKNAERFMSDVGRPGKKNYTFACGGESIVYLQSDKIAETWLRKISSR